MPILIIISCMFLVGIAWQDFKFRAVYWWLFPSLFLALGIWQFLMFDSGAIVQKLFYNTTFIMLQLFFVWVYLSLKKSEAINIFKGYFGLGDLLFLISITVYFSFLNYAVFYLVSLFLVVIFSLIKNLMSKEKETKIPLAGYQALMVLACVLLDQFFVKLNLGSDLWLINYLAL